MFNSIMVKTEAGQAALKDRHACPALTGRLRTLLLQVDGHKTGGQLNDMAESLGAPVGSVGKLVELGLIEASTTAELELVAADILTETSDSHTAPATATVAKPAPPKAVAIPDTISPEEEATVATVRGLLKSVASEYLGLSGLFFTRKLEKSTRLEELRPLVEELRKAIAKARNKVHADLAVDDIVKLLQ
ncbi:hypothetical protein [Parachitinimonas caeni]|uniref:Uncharacterized protein n=1 Tax=Parachitinimonas caeni TaxID=3031301 RepID=A0ABT7E074_9NEIS|nr:hypothetical protein [Parachitinimonas caeni]MDK2125705.1 hypothetical protein [Parachitinimonas caeni]